MLESINLDTEQFEDIVEEARKKISVLYPEWTDYNYHDPGITIIELFAWLKEIQQYYLNRMGIQNKDIFFKLLGIQRLHNAGALVNIEAETNVTRRLPEKSRFLAGEIVFETITEKTLIRGNIKKLLIKDNQGIRSVSLNGLGSDGAIREYPFGRKVKKGNVFYLLFNESLPTFIELSIFFRFSRDNPVARNSIGDFPFYPLAVLSYEYFTEEGFRAISSIHDETHGLVQDGYITFTLEEDMKKTRIFEEEGYVVKVEVLEQEYDVAPFLTGISANMVQARQEETIFDFYDIPVQSCSITKENCLRAENPTMLALKGEEKIFLKQDGIYREVEFTKILHEKEQKGIYEIPLPSYIRLEGIRIVYVPLRGWNSTLLGIGNGCSDQRFQLNMADIPATANNMISYHNFEVMTIKEGEGVWWLRRENFYQSGSCDCHYVFLEETGEIIFGDGVFGKCPEGEIRIIRLKTTRGSGGNVKPGAITKPGASNYESAFGGKNSETVEDAVNHFCRELKKGRRLVTKEDFERMVMETPGLMIRTCKVMESEKEANLIEIAVKPYSEEEKSRLSHAYERNIYRYLEDKRTIGTKIRLLSPEYVEIEIYGDILIRPQYFNARGEIEEGIKKYFREKNNAFGQPIVYHQLITFIDRIDAVLKVQTLTLVTTNERVDTNLQGDLILPANAIVQLRSIEFLYQT